MEQIRYIHAADLHLDTPFLGIAKTSAELADCLRGATFKVLTRLTRLCLAHKPDFLLLAGDLYNDEERSIKAQLKLLENCVVLAEAGIRVLIVSGNHDPLSSRFHALDWPANTYFFPAEPQKVVLKKGGKPMALVHGASHADGREGRNLARMIKRDPQFEGFQLGLLHCNVDGAVKSDRYAPCSLSDLLDSGLDAWALGHAHCRNILSQKPFIAYAGNPQGLSCNETGPRGCFLVTASKTESGWECEAIFHELGPVVWENVDIDLNEVATLNEVERRLNAALDQNYGSVAEKTILSAKFTGRTVLARQLSQAQVLEDFCSLGRNAVRENIWLRSLVNTTAPLIDEAENLERDDLLGEVARVAQRLGGQPAELKNSLEAASAGLARAAREILGELDSAGQQELLGKAQRICQDMLEGR